MVVPSDREEQQRILSYWLGDNPNDPVAVKEKQKLWYAGSDELDSEIREQFGEIFDRACAETILHWGESADGALALVILFDQFSRNLHRGTARAFAQDPMARAVAKRAFNHGLDEEMTVPGRIFLMHPFHHSEAIIDQELGCVLLQRLIKEGHEEWSEFLQSSEEWFEGHRDIVKQFTRFPHRNEVLGRKSTTEEEEYLKDSSSFGQ